VDDAFLSEEIIFQSDIGSAEISAFFAINFAFRTLMSGKKVRKNSMEHCSSTKELY
jgi:hypothetical protein